MSNHPAPLPPPTPPRAPDGAALAIPRCVTCGTDEGALMHHEGRLIPVRIDGKCLDCLQHPGRIVILKAPPPSDDMTTPSAPPCLECGTIWGRIDAGCTSPERRRGLCHNCYSTSMRRGTLDQYPSSVITRKNLLIIAAQRRAQARVVARERRWEDQRMPRAAAHLRDHPEQLAPEALDRLFVYPAGTRAPSYWLTPDDREAA